MSELSKRDRLKDAIFDTLLDIFENGRVVETEDGPRVVQPDASTINVARQVVKDFDSLPFDQAVKGAPKGVLKQFAKVLPFPAGEKAEAN